MKKFLAVLLALCMVLSVGVTAFASGEPSGEASGEAVVPGEYTDGVSTLVIADDLTFSMETVGENMDGGEFVLLITGTVTADGVFTIDGLFDGELNLAEIASEEQVAANLATVEAVYAAGGGAAGGTDEEAYHAYLKEYVSAVPAAQDNLDEFFALIDASDYGTMPADMLFNAQWWGYAAMTYDEFVAAGGVYEIPAFDPNLVPD